MLKITLGIEGMRCEKCEAKVNRTITEKFGAKKVTSSHTTNETVVITEKELDENKLRETIDALGFKLTSVNSEEYKKSGLFGIFG